MSIRHAHPYKLSENVLWVSHGVLVLAWSSANQQKFKIFINGQEKTSSKNSNTHVGYCPSQGEYLVIFSQFLLNIFSYVKILCLENMSVFIHDRQADPLFLTRISGICVIRRHQSHKLFHPLGPF